MKQHQRRKCLNCQQLFRPNPRVGNRQRYCSAPECRRASKVASQRHWHKKPENADYFRGPEQVARVQDWRARHPGYWRRGATNPVALQDQLVTSTRRLHKLATDVLTQGVHDEKTPDLSGTRPDGADAVQLDRSPSGPQPPR